MMTSPDDPVSPEFNAQCMKALDLLREALDLAPPRSAVWYAIADSIARLAGAIDTAAQRTRSH